jgi:redox-sensitive bicupin YhaK (pirin superfamily)
MKEIPVDKRSGVVLRDHARIGRLGPNLELLRPLPNPSFEAVGPFVFMDHLGPVAPLHEMVPAHPHAGIEVLTYLIHGWNEHRDSLGNRASLTDGGVQWITAGRGILHAEIASSQVGQPFEGLQIWSRLPHAQQDCDPEYHAIKAEQVPEYRRDGTTVRLLAGSLRPMIATPGPVLLAQAAFLAHVHLEVGEGVAIPLPSVMEIGIYVIDGTVRVEDEVFSKADIAIVQSSPELLIANEDRRPADILVLGGDRAERPLVYRGSYVYASSEDVEAANQRYLRGEMGSSLPEPAPYVALDGQAAVNALKDLL